MSFSTFAGTAIVPTLSRIVLCAAFLPAGWNKVMDETTFSGDDAQRLIQLGVIDAEPQAHIGLNRSIVPASFQDEEAGDDQAPDESPEPQEQPAVPADEADTTPSEPATYTAKPLHVITLMLDKAGWPAPVWMARLAAFTELVGGGLLFVGLFSRFWGLGLAIAMGVAFYLTSWNLLLDSHLFDLKVPDFNRMFTQTGLFVLAFGVFLTGAGPISLDRALFRKTVDEDDDEDEDA
ncbi:MAG: DoxX family membrane protein [Planctomycetes bacterium]|nr:DoxX family membrane protein [Planctomycetota bacterium]